MSRSRLVAAVCAAAAAVSVLATGCGASGGAAAEVAGTEYSVEDMNDYLATVDPDNEARAERADAAVWLSDWVFFTAVELELAERGVSVTNDHSAQAVAELTEADASFVPGAAGGDVAIRQRAVVLAALDWVQREVPTSLSDQPLRHLCSRHILVASESEAADVLSRLDDGEEFGSLALDLSLDPGSGSLGGDLGCVVEGSFVAPFETAAYAARPGDVVVAESQFGFHVIEVISSGPATAADHPQLDAAILASMAEDSELALLERAQAAAQAGRNEMLVELQETVFDQYATRVSIDDRYGRWDPDQFRVVAEPAG